MRDEGGPDRQTETPGVVKLKPAVEMTKEDFDAQFEPNVWGCFTVAQAAAKLVSPFARWPVRFSPQTLD